MFVLNPDDGNKVANVKQPTGHSDDSDLEQEITAKSGKTSQSKAQETVDNVEQHIGQSALSDKLLQDSINPIDLDEEIAGKMRQSEEITTEMGMAKVTDNKIGRSSSIGTYVSFE